jgi:putative aldouronate transport system substrate-binding protein
MKKILAILLALTMVFTFIAACSDDTPTVTEPTPTPATPETEEAAPASDPEPPASGEPPTVVTVWFCGGNAENNSEDVVIAANARLQELGLNIEINPVFTGSWGMGEPAQIALDTGDAGIDVFWTAGWGLNYFTNARIGNFVRLDEPGGLLETYGQDLLREVDSALWEGFRANGPSGNGLYGIPGPKDFGAARVLDVNNDRLAELGFVFEDIFTETSVNSHVIFEPIFEEILVAAKELYGDNFFSLYIEHGNFVQMISDGIYMVGSSNTFQYQIDPADPGRLAVPGFSMTIENARYVEALELINRWFNMGFIDPRLAIGDLDIIGEMHRAGEYLFSAGQTAYGHVNTVREERGIDVREAPLQKVFVDTGSATGSGFGISVYSGNQAAAMQFMNAWYTDNALANILTYGAPGIHWDYTADGLVELNQEARESTPYQTWRNGMGNVFILTATTTDPGGHQYMANFRAFYEAGTATPFAGFFFDAESVDMQMAAIQGVIEEFRQALTLGAMNPDTAIPAFLAALEANGLRDVEAEMQRQVDAFLAG